MSDVNIRISVREKEIEDAIARIEAAIVKRDILLTAPTVRTTDLGAVESEAYGIEVQQIQLQISELLTRIEHAKTGLSDIDVRSKILSDLETTILDIQMRINTVTADAADLDTATLKVDFIKLELAKIEGDVYRLTKRIFELPFRQLYMTALGIQQRVQTLVEQGVVIDIKTEERDHELTELEARLKWLKLELLDERARLLPEAQIKWTPEYIETSLDRWVEKFESADARTAWIEQRVDQVLFDVGGLDAILLRTEIQADARTAWLEQRVDQVLFDVGGLDAILLRTEIQAEVVEAKVISTEAQLGGLTEMLDAINLPGVSRGTRMVLLRIPGLREALRLMYQIKMLQREVFTAGPLGKVVAGIVVIIYLFQALEKMQRANEARLAKLEADMEVRAITLEEAVRGYGVLPERYRATVPP